MRKSNYYQWDIPEQNDTYDVDQAGAIFDNVDGELHLQKETAKKQGIVLVQLDTAVDAQLIVSADHDARIKALEDALFNDLSKNPFIIRFENLDGVVVTGVWNAEKRHMEC